MCIIEPRVFRFNMTCTTLPSQIHATTATSTSLSTLLGWKCPSLDEDLASHNTCSSASVRKRPTACSSSDSGSGHSRKVLGLNCDLCGKWFSCRADMDKHVRSHTGERPYQCHLCSYSATVKCNLRRHLVTIHKADLLPDARV